MNKATNLSMAIPILLFFIACSNNDTANTKSDNHEGHDTTKVLEAAEPVGTLSFSLKDKKISAVFEYYIQLTTALTNSDIAEAKIAANAIEAGAKEITGAGSVASTAAKITSAPDLKTQRIAYSTLSQNFIDLVKQSGLNNGELYVDYCPMALNDKGASWLSNKKEIRNPYFGETMLTCGEVKETIK